MERLQKRLGNNLISYHGCGIYRLDGSNVLVTKDFPFSMPIKNCFWMKAEDAVNIIRTRSTRADQIIEKQIHKNFYLKSLSIPTTSYSSDESSYSDTCFSDEPSSTSEESEYGKLIVDTKETTTD